MTIKQVVLGVLTVVVVMLVGTSLLNSWTKPQIQSQLQLYQTNLLLQASDWQSPEGNLGSTRNALIGDDPLKTALSQYQEARQSAQANLVALTQKRLGPKANGSEPSPELGSSPVRPSAKKQLQRLIAQLDLRSGILQAQLGQTDAALKTWKELIVSKDSPQAETAAVLTGLWSTPPRLLPDAEQQLSHLKGWFRYQALARLYQLQQRQDALSTLQAMEQEIAQSALVRLVVVGVMPALGGLIGLGLMIGWGVQQVRQRSPLAQLTIIVAATKVRIRVQQVRQRSPLAQTQSPLSSAAIAATWPVPWDWQTIWQVMVLWFIAFFGISLILVPLAVAVSGLNPATFGARAQTSLALFSYTGLVAAGLSILYVCLKSFPHPGWFRATWKGNWFWWGLGGYLAALPLVIVTSLINQRLLQNQGGGNPLLEVILQSRDGVTIALLFLMVAGLAPFFEETLFRGFLLPSLTRYLPPWGAIALTGLLFAVAHLNLSDILPLTALGMVLGFTYLRSRNLLASMLLHSLWNSGSFLGLLVLSSGSS